MVNRLIVIEKDPVVSMDLSQQLATILPDALIEVFQSLDDAATSLVDKARASLAVIALPSSDIGCPGIKELKALLSDRLILLVDRVGNDEKSFSDVVPVLRPFTDTMIADAMDRLGITPPKGS